MLELSIGVGAAVCMLERSALVVGFGGQLWGQLWGQLGGYRFTTALW